MQVQYNYSDHFYKKDNDSYKHQPFTAGPRSQIVKKKKYEKIIDNCFEDKMCATKYTPESNIYLKPLLSLPPSEKWLEHTSMLLNIPYLTNETKTFVQKKQESIEKLNMTLQEFFQNEAYCHAIDKHFSTFQHAILFFYDFKQLTTNTRNTVLKQWSQHVKSEETRRFSLFLLHVVKFHLKYKYTVFDFIQQLDLYSTRLVLLYSADTLFAIESEKNNMIELISIVYLMNLQYEFSQCIHQCKMIQGLEMEQSNQQGIKLVPTEISPSLRRGITISNFFMKYKQYSQEEINVFNCLTLEQYLFTIEMINRKKVQNFTNGNWKNAATLQKLIVPSAVGTTNYNVNKNREVVSQMVHQNCSQAVSIDAASIKKFYEISFLKA